MPLSCSWLYIWANWAGASYVCDKSCFGVWKRDQVFEGILVKFERHPLLLRKKIFVGCLGSVFWVPMCGISIIRQQFFCLVWSLIRFMYVFFYWVNYDISIGCFHHLNFRLLQPSQDSCVQHNCNKPSDLVHGAYDSLYNESHCPWWVGGNFSRKEWVWKPFCKGTEIWGMITNYILWREQ